MKTIRTLLSSLLCIASIYFGLCALFIFQSSFTDYTCPGAANLPTNWTLPKKVTSTSPTDSSSRKYPLLDSNDWQLDSFQNVEFASRMQNVTIRAWYTEIDKNAPVVIVVHGIRPNCKSAYESLLVSGMLARGGINVLNIDLQNYGESTKFSQFIAYGQREYLDLLGAYDWLRTQGYQTDQIGLMGLSLGAVTSAIAFSQEEEIKAVWLDSPFTDFNTMFCFELNSRQLPCFFKYGVHWIGTTFLDIDPNKISPASAITNHPDRYIFLTHGKDDTRIPFSHAETFLSLAKEKQANIDFWFIEDSKHLEAMLQYPRLYQKKLVDFFTKHLTRHTLKHTQMTVPSS